MKTTSTVLRAGAACLLLASTALTAPALAQSAPPPRFNQVDANGVDLVTGDFFFSMTEGSIGSGEGALALVRNWAGPAGWTDNWSGAAYLRTISGSTQVVVEFGSYSDTFTISGGNYTATKGNGATLVATIGGGYRYTAPDGTQIDFSTGTAGYPMQGPMCQRATGGGCTIPTEVRQPDGMTHTLDWDVEERCLQYEGPLNCVEGASYSRFRGVSNSANYRFTVNYLTDTPGTGVPVANWFVRTQAQFANLDGAPGSLPTVTYSTVSSTVLDVTDIGGQTWRLTNDSAGQLTGIRRPGASSDTTTIGYSTNAISVTNEGVTTGYAWSDSGQTRTMTATDAASEETEIVSDLAIGRISSVTDPLSHQTSFQYDSNARLTRQTQPEGNSIGYTYDARGNVTETRTREKDDNGDTGDDIVSTASYDSTCSNVVTCNQPNSVTDALNRTTDFTYDSTHGGVLTVTAPAPSGSGDRPQTRYSYNQITAVTGQPVYMLTEVSACSSGTTSSSPSCVGTANETRTVAAYDTDNLRVTSVTRRNGDNSLTATSAFTYDAIGNLLTVDGPLSTADVTRFRYDNGRRTIGVSGPDPDGTGSLKHRAQRITYRSDGQASAVDTGTVDGISDSDWASMTVLRSVQVEYDASNRPVVQRLVSGSTTYALTQTSYDALGRVRCVAQRMNTSQFATSSLPADNCTLDTEGSHGPDRIARTSYNAAGQVTKVETGVGVTADAADEVRATYTDNGRVATVTDAEGNMTTYEYDMFDRLLNTRFPSPTTDGVSAPTSGTGNDFEQLGYDNAGNVTNLRLRDNTNIAFTYDALSRLITKDPPGSELTVTYSYDLLGRMTGASQTGHSLTFTYDALGRRLTETGPLGTVASTYDAGGRRTLLTGPGSYAVGYSHLATGEVTGLLNGNGDPIAAFAYDGTGRRTTLALFNGAGTTYSYDNVSRLTQMAVNFSGTSHDLTLDFTDNPAGQIATNTRSNDSYAWAGHYAVNRGYTANGLNQYSAIASINPTYDNRGNLTSAGSITYGYDSANRLVTASGGVTLSYDPLGRLYEVATSGGATRRFAYDGMALTDEYDAAGNKRHVYIHGPNIDEPLIWFDIAAGAFGTYQADERGSIVALANNGGAATAINRYDEYGIPGSGNAGAFQYTGQMWLPELGMYHYRARAYSPTLGRFMQTDPIGYEGGMNLHAYVLNDPVNLVDPSGLSPDCDDESTWWDGDSRHKGGCYGAVVMGPSGGWAPMQYFYDYGNTEGLGQTGSAGSAAAPPPRPPQRCRNGGRIQRMEVTGYDNGYRSTGKNPGHPAYGITASGRRAGPGTLAAPRAYPFGTEMYVPGRGLGVVLDRGGAIREGRLDVWFPTEREALEWGRRHLDVEVCR